MTETYLWTKPRLLTRDHVLLRGNVEQGRLGFDSPLGADSAGGSTLPAEVKAVLLFAGGYLPVLQHEDVTDTVTTAL